MNLGDRFWALYYIVFLSMICNIISAGNGTVSHLLYTDHLQNYVHVPAGKTPINGIEVLLDTAHNVYAWH